VSGRAQGYRNIRRAIDARQRVFDRQSARLTPLRIARFRALERMYATALLVAAAADEAQIAEPEGITSWADEILQLGRLREGNVRRLRAKGWSGEETSAWGDGRSREPEPHALSMGVPNRSPATRDLVDEEQSAAAVGATRRTNNSWLDISDIVIRDGDGDAGEIA